MDLTTAVNSLGSDYVNKVSDLLTNKTNTASGTTDDSSFDSVFNLSLIHICKEWFVNNCRSGVRAE